MIEVLLAIAITAILGTLVTSFIIYTTRSYGKSLNESTLQQDAQVILAQLNSYIINADDTIEYEVNGVSCKSDALSGESTYNTKELSIYKTAGTGKTVEYITWTAATKELTYRMDSIDSSGTVTTSIPAEILATKVADFKADLTNLTSDKQVKLDLVMEGTAGETYTADATVYLRNGKVATVSANPSTPVVSTVTSVTVVPASKILRQGESWDFNARVYGTNNPSQEVTWTIENNLDTTLTKVDPETGEVTISPSEESETIIVRATSVQDPTKSGIGYVYVDTSTKLSLGTIRDYWIYTGSSLYLYGRPDGNLESAITWSVETANGNGSYSLTQLSDKTDAATFRANQVGTYTIRIEGIVDGITYKDKAIVHVRDMSSEYSVHGNNRDAISIIPDTGWDYWLCAGESLTLDTTVGADYTDMSMREWTASSSSRIASTNYSLVASGDNNEKMTITIADECRTGEINLRATIKNNYNYFYDEITIHVYEPFDYPYIIETTKMDDANSTSNNAYYLRNMVAGPVRLADSASDLKVLDEEKLNAMLGLTGYQLIENQRSVYVASGLNLPTKSKYTNMYLKKPNDYVRVSLSSVNTVRFGANCDIMVADTDVWIEGPKITTAEDTVIWVKGDHELTMRWGDVYFDGLIYAPEGTVNIKCNKGMFRGVIIAKEVNISADGWGNDEMGFMEKQSVMDLVNSLRKE